MKSTQKRIQPAPEAPEWHTKDVPAVYAVLETRPEGLTTDEIKERRRRYGVNRFSKGSQRTFFDRLYGQSKNPLTLVLFASVLITFVLGHTIDAIVILFALLVAVALGLFQEGRASRAFEKLAASQVHTAVVLRENKRHEISAEDIVCGDIVFLQSGVQVPADMRLIETKHLKVNEAPLTGEWLAVTKDTASVPRGVTLAEQTNMAWKGTFVVDGYGSGVVVAVGDQTEVGALSLALTEVEEVETPLQMEMKRISHLMFVVIAVLVVVIFAIGIFRGESVADMLVTAIAIAVASIPEGLPAAVTIVLAISMEALLRRGGLVRNLLAAETLGGATFVLTDKTGTLTEGRMAVAEVMHAESKEGTTLGAQDTSALTRALFDTALCASDAFMDEVKDDKEAYIVRGEPMERAILEAALDIGVTVTGESARAMRTDFLSFSSENRFAAGIASREGSHVLCINGAPEYILEAATALYERRRAIPFTAEERKRFSSEIARLTKEGKRVIAVACKEVSGPDITVAGPSLIENCIFMGLLIFNDPVRTDVSEAIKAVQQSGAVVRLVTGDNPETALSIARAVGIARPHDVALTGKDITGLSDAELYTVLKTAPVFARILPRQKMRLAQVLQKYGEIVAMTGDGINDAPALQKAHIGIALGSGTEVAKEASDLVLVNDSFKIIYAAIEEGRRIIHNLRKIIGYLLSTSLSEVVLIGSALILAAPLPLVPAQILWVNLIGEGFMSVAFAFEPGDARSMKERPADVGQGGVLNSTMRWFIVMMVFFFSASLIALYLVLLGLSLPLETLRSIMFLSLSVSALFIAFSFRSLTVPVWRINFFSNKFFIGSFAVSLALLLIAISVPFMQTLLSYTPLPALWVVLTVLYGFFSMLVIEIAKWFFFK